MESEQIKQKYRDVGNLLEETLEKAGAIELVGEEENKELELINSTLSTINEEFKKEIAQLEDSSEWDKYCITFFGETNAGKSTIIEALRIIYDEEKRREELINQGKDYKDTLVNHIDEYKALVEGLRNMHDYVVKTERRYREEIEDLDEWLRNMNDYVVKTASPLYKLKVLAPSFLIGLLAGVGMTACYFLMIV